MMNSNAPEYTPTRKPHPRVTNEAQSYAERNRGGTGLWGTPETNGHRPESSQGGRTVTSEGQRNAEMNKGSMNSIMGGYPDPAPQRKLHPRGVQSDAKEIAGSNQGDAMKSLIDDYGNLDFDQAPAQKVHGDEAAYIAERNAGNLGDVIYSTELPPEEPPRQQLGYGGQEVADKHTGANMGPLLSMDTTAPESPREAKVSRLHETSKGGGWDEAGPAVRTRPEAEEIIARQNTSFMNDIMHQAPVQSDGSSSQQPKVAKQLEETPTPRPQSGPVRTRPEGMEIYHKQHSSEMASIMRGDVTEQARPSRRNPQMQRSELW